eukprot:2524245-Pleurochrysis_carterae.AAC.1
MGAGGKHASAARDGGRGGHPPETGGAGHVAGGGRGHAARGTAAGGAAPHARLGVERERRRCHTTGAGD